jgi:hypothetical protein
MYVSEAKHLKAFLGYVKANGLAGTLKKHDWQGFAAGYNGTEYRRYNYDTRIQAAYDALVAARPPRPGPAHGARH